MLYKLIACTYIFLLMLCPVMAKTILITGASQGLGKTLTEIYAQNGWSVWAGTRNPSKLNDINPNIHPIFLDVSNYQSIQDAVGVIMEHNNQIDVVINNAGYMMIAPPDQIELHTIEKLIDINFMGAVRVCDAVLPFMLQQGNGYIINISSTAGIQAIPGLEFFSASKFALEGYSEALAASVKHLGIKVILIEPALIKTDWLQNCEYNQSQSFLAQNKIYQSLYDRMLARTEHGQDPQDIAHQIMTICYDPSPHLRYATNSHAQMIMNNRLRDPTGTAYLSRQETYIAQLLKH